MKLPPRGLDAFVKKPPPHMAAILVYGPDEGLVRERIALLTKTVVADANDPFNVADIPGESLGDNPARLSDEAQSISMLGGRRVVRVRGGDDRTVAAIAKDVLPNLKKGDNLVLVEAGALGPNSALRKLFEGADNAAAVPCYVDDERDASRVILDSLREAGYRMSSDALSLMASGVTGDRAIARGEVEKLITYMGPMKDIGIEDVSACIGGAAAIPLDDLARHVASGRLKEADRILTFVQSEGLNAVVVLRTLQNYFMRLHLVKSKVAAGEGLEMALSKLRPQVFFKQKPDFTAQVNALSAAQIEQALNVIVSAEARCKQSGALPEIIAGRAVLSLCQLTGRAAARRRA